MPDPAAHRRLIERFWDTLYVDRDLDRVGEFFAEDGHYEDVPAPDSGADGPRNIAARIRIGHEPVEAFEHHVQRMVCEGDTVVTEHAETWKWHTGESVSLPFVSIHVIRDGKIALWRDYWDMGTLLNAAPKWWLEHIMKHSQADFGD